MIEAAFHSRRAESAALGSFLDLSVMLFAALSAGIGAYLFGGWSLAVANYGVLLVASLGGAPKHPTWFYNLVKNPDVDVYVKGEKLELRARQAGPAEKAEIWPICCEYYPDYAVYQTRTERDIPVFVCEPRW